MGEMIMTETQKTKSTEETTTKKHTVAKKVGSWSLNYIMNVLAYSAVIIGGMALFIAMILSKVGISAEFVGTMQKIANCVGWLVLCLLSTKYALKRRSILMWVIWIVAVGMIITGIVLI